MHDGDIDQATRAALDRYGFDAQLFARHRNEVAAGALAPGKGVVAGTIELPDPRVVSSLPGPGSDPHAEFTRLGRDCIAQGQVALLILAGGMATRFGGGVKALVDAVGGKTFLQLKLADARAAGAGAGGVVPVWFMTSFATDLAVRTALGDAQAEAFAQFISIRMDRGGTIFRTADGKPSLYAPGHGDMSFALRRAGLLQRFRARGGRLVIMCNVDNLAATVDPTVIGAHLAAGRPMTAELVRKDPGDVGGAPARIDGHTQIVEAFRFPPAFAQDRIPWFSTNSLVFDAAELERDFALDWFAVEKKVEGRPALQVERLVGQLSAHMPVTFLEVERAGLASRFEPIKDPDELVRRRPNLESLLLARGIL
jgi:UTP--glucose-1-phosphate uridylyltransferase